MRQTSPRTALLHIAQVAVAFSLATAVGGLGEVVVLAEIDQVRIGPLQVGETVVAAHPLVARAEGLAVAQAVGEQPLKERLSMRPPRALPVSRLSARRKSLSRLSAVTPMRPLETEEMLGVDLLQFAVVVAAGD